MRFESASIAGGYGGQRLLIHAWAWAIGNDGTASNKPVWSQNIMAPRHRVETCSLLLPKERYCTGAFSVEGEPVAVYAKDQKKRVTASIHSIVFTHVYDV